MKLLKIDMDFKPPEEWLKKYLRQCGGLLTMKYGYDVESRKCFETKRGYHIYIKLKEDIDAETVNMLQFLLGDDRTRVKINQWRIKRGIPRWNKLFAEVLYRKKAKALTCYYCGNRIPVPDRWFEDAEG